MSRLKIQNIPFKTKLFLSVGILFLTLTLIVSLLFSRTSIQNTITNERTSSDIILERISTQIDSLYEQMNIAATSITKNPSLRSIVLNLNTSESETAQAYISQLQQERTIQTALGNMMFSPIISNVILYNREKNYFYYTGTYYDDMDYVDQVLSTDRAAESFNTDSVIYRAPAHRPWTLDERMVLSVLRNFADAATTQDTIVEIQVSSQRLKDLCTQDTFRDEKEILIFDSDGRMVYPYDRGITTLPVDSVAEIQSQIRAGENRYYSYDYAYYARQSDTTGFTVVLISNNETVHRQTRTYIFTTVITVLLTLILTLGIIFTLITQFTRPLNQLIYQVNKLSLDSDTKLTLPSDTFNEFEILNTSLNQMVVKLKASIQEIYELEIRESNANLAALQAQVDPHFLYNALNSISAASEVYGSDVTTVMCQDLSSMMRYVTSKKTEVPLIEELTHTKNYLEFMKISNDTNFDYIIDAPRELYDLLIPRLSIQPFAENSFRHGFKNTLPPWHLSLVCRADPDGWEIEITDNGGGFSQDALSHISEEPMEATELEINGLGLNNTFSRLSLYFGEQFSYKVENLSRGCRITLKGAFKHD